MFAEMPDGLHLSSAAPRNVSRDVTAQRDALEETIDRLYGLPLDEFTQARDAAVKERRAAKDRDGAEALKQQRKPNLVAWSLNRVRRSDPDAIEELIEAGERLGEAQRQLVASGARGSLRDAGADERAHVRRVAELASAELAAAGKAPDAGIQSKLFATLHAAAASSDVREQLTLGRLLRDHELSDLGLGDSVPLAAPPRSDPPRSDPPRSAPKRSEAKPTAAERARERNLRAVSDRLARATDRHHELAAKAEQAQGAARDAERAARQAAKAFERAEAAVEKTAAAAARAAAAADRAAATVSELQDELAALG